MTAGTGAKYDQKVDAMMEEASKALAHGEYFKAERLAKDALQQTFRRQDYERMERILLPLEEARRQKRLAAVDSDNLIITSNAEDLDGSVRTGCYLLEPLLVAADGRNLRDRADEEEIPVLIVVREPLTKKGHWPLAMVGPVTVRTRVDPPEDVTCEWVLAASEALGEEAIEMVDPQRDIENIVSDLYDRLQTCPESDRLHQSLMGACRAALREKHGA